MLILFLTSKAKTLLRQTSHWCYKLNKFNLVNFAKDRGNCPLLFHKLVCLSANLSKTSLSDETLTFVDRKLSLPLSDGSEIASFSSKLNCSSVVSSMNNLSNSSKSISYSEPSAILIGNPEFDPCPLHQTFLLERARFIGQPLSALFQRPSSLRPVTRGAPLRAIALVQNPCCGRGPEWLSFLDECPRYIFFSCLKLNKYCLEFELPPAHQVIKRLKMDHLWVYTLYPISCRNGYRMW